MQKKGFTLLETLVVIVIIGIISMPFAMKINDIYDQNDLKSMKTRIPRFFNSIFEKSKIYKKRYYFVLNFNENKIEVYNNEERDDFEEKLILSKRLNYRIITSTGKDNTIKKKTYYETTETGNINQSFSLYLFFKNDNIPILRITIDNTRKIKFAEVNIYEPDAKLTATNFHYSYKWKLIKSF